MESLDQLRKGTTTMAVLKLLADVAEPMHGYQIVKALQARSQGAFQFSEGLIYPRLHQMENDGLLQSDWVETEGGRRRKCYRATPDGERRLTADLRRWQDFNLAMTKLLGVGG